MATSPSSEAEPDGDLERKMQSNETIAKHLGPKKGY
jgi:hypothetical protein